MVALLLSLTGGLASEAIAEEVIGMWVVEHDSSDGYYAATMNDSGNIMGQFCFQEIGSCLWILGLDTACDEGHRSPILVNADSGSTSLSVYCDGQLGSGLYRYAFTDFEAIAELVESNPRIGFAIPLEGDRFAVERFVMKGASRAIERMRREVESDSSGPTGTKSQIM